MNTNLNNTMKIILNFKVKYFYILIILINCNIKNKDELLCKKRIEYYNQKLNEFIISKDTNLFYKVIEKLDSNINQQDCKYKKVSISNKIGIYYAFLNRDEEAINFIENLSKSDLKYMYNKGFYKNLFIIKKNIYNLKLRDSIIENQKKIIFDFIKIEKIRNKNIELDVYCDLFFLFSKFNSNIKFKKEIRNLVLKFPEDSIKIKTLDSNYKDFEIKF